jgi:hypothetical protein
MLIFKLVIDNRALWPFNDTVYTVRHPDISNENCQQINSKYKRIS